MFTVSKGWSWPLNVGSLCYFFLQAELLFKYLDTSPFFFPINLVGKLGLCLSRIRGLFRLYYLLSTLD